jgi:dynein heavy chain 1, cytosolic
MREARVGTKLLSQVQKDLKDLIQVCRGEIKQTNHLRSLMSQLAKGKFFSIEFTTYPYSSIGTIPTNWKRYKVPKAMAVAGWIPNFSQRLAQLEKVAQLGSFSGLTVWLGGLFFPEAYITATRQAVAHRMSWSLETLDLRLDVEQEGDPTAFAVEGKMILFQLSRDAHSHSKV